MSFIDQEANDTILHGWRNDKSVEETATELLEFHNYVANVLKLFNKKKRSAKQKKKSKKQKEMSG